MVLLEAPSPTEPDRGSTESEGADAVPAGSGEPEPPAGASVAGPVPEPAVAPPKATHIFLGHGKNKKPLEQLKNILNQFKISYRVTVEEPNKGLPIPDKVAELMRQCSSAILVFTRDECFYDKDGKEVWRPSENVVHELGAASILYGGKIIILKEAGLTLPSNFSSIGYIEFNPDALEAKGVDLLKELIAFGLVKVTAAT